eukprot:TRINITY_DN29432_c0_g1_i2.p1 TRINITY_DN29432_c0_g1~~TRINITY_DN29432_c0_g1_i2.p1  ORF type:complete len:334 (-),score=30.01 TRINITY_DN29432_c0_g1_i2:122-1123(-)
MAFHSAYVAGEKEGLIQEKPLIMGEAQNKNLNLDIEAEVKLVQERLNELNVKGVNQAAQSAAMKELGLERARIFGWPNTYVFTKAMGEMLIGTFREKLPLVIVRPTIITSTYKDPFPGWMEGIRTVDTLIVNYAKGNLKCFMADPNSIMDAIPVDMVVNLTIITIIAHSSQPSQFIYQLGSSVRNPLKYYSIPNWCYQYFLKNPCIRNDGKPIKYQICTLLTTRSSFNRYMNLHYNMPIQVFRIVSGALCQLFNSHYNHLDKKYKRIMQIAKLYEFYVFFKGRFDDSNSESFRKLLKGEGVEENMFQIDPKCIDWEDYFITIHLPGVVKYLIK